MAMRLMRDCLGVMSASAIRLTRSSSRSASSCDPSELFREERRETGSDAAADSESLAPSGGGGGVLLDGGGDTEERGGDTEERPCEPMEERLVLSRLTRLDL
mmetsp:Transcript_5133/g.14590  ORF Transcript_5133/g.14590 Transcript_5133/m.14590 type:complete len:102 (-) Transcript_5133:2006-2311(-)